MYETMAEIKCSEAKGVDFRQLCVFVVRYNTSFLFVCFCLVVLSTAMKL